MKYHGLLFVSWQPHCSRSDNIARELGGTSVMVYSPGWGSSKVALPFRWLSQAVKTVVLLNKEKPAVVFVMTPPVVASIAVWLYAKLAGVSYMIDAHSGAFIDERWRRIIFLHRFASRRAAITLVTNRTLMKEVESWGANALVVTDVPVVFEDRVVTKKDAFRITMPASFTYDEPLEAVIEAARRLPGVNVFVTGDTRRAPKELLARKPKNVMFTGFLPTADYGELLQSSDAVMALTTCDHTMQRGAYEAVYMGRPVITSNFQILRDAFDKGTVYVDPSADSIHQGIKKMMEDLPRYQREVHLLRVEKLQRWKDVSKELGRIIVESCEGENPET